MRRAHRWLLVLPISVLLFLISLVPFRWPQTDDPKTADAVVILSGDHGERLSHALRMMEEKVAPTLVFVGTIDRAMEDELCQGGRVPYEVLCVRPDPDSTRHEARAAGQLAESRGWRTIVVVTSTQHVTRSALLFRRCFSGTVQMVAGWPPFSGKDMAREILREWAKVGHALTLSRGC